MTNRATRRTLLKIKPKTYILDTYLTGELKGAHVVMAGMTGLDLIRIQTGDVSEAEAMQFTASKVIEHNLDTDDVLSLDLPVLLQISQAWRDAMRDSAVPPTSASS